jgi:nucleotide-binding universal stress UspA family protein
MMQANKTSTPLDTSVLSQPSLLLHSFAQAATATTPTAHSRPAPAVGRPVTLAIATDGATHAQQARALAQRLAQAFQAQLQVIVIADAHQNAGAAQHLMQGVQQRLGDWAAKAQFIPLVGRTDIVLERYLREHPVDLLVIGAFKDRDAGPIAHIGFTAQQVVQKSPNSVLVAKGYQPRLRKLLAFVPEWDETVIEVATDWAHALNAELKLLHVLPAEKKAPKPLSPPLNELPLNEILARGLFTQAPSRLSEEITALSFEAAQTAEPSRAPFLQATRARMEAAGLAHPALLLRRGPTVETILYVAAQEQADLIVVGSQGPHTYFLDSTANAVVQLAAHSVLVVRPAGPATQRF